VPVDRLDLAAEPPQEEHVEEDVPDRSSVVQEGVSEQPPDLPVQNLVHVQEQGVGERLRIGNDGPAQLRMVHHHLLAGQQLQEEEDDIDGDQPLADLAPLDERGQDARPLAAVVFAVVNAHDRDECSRSGPDGAKGGLGGGRYSVFYHTFIGRGKGGDREKVSQTRSRWRKPGGEGMTGKKAHGPAQGRAQWRAVPVAGSHTRQHALDCSRCDLPPGFPKRAQILLRAGG
jgi:hypothetical protein